MASYPIISVNAFGIGTHHPPGFMRIRKGCGDYLFLHFLTPYRIHLKDQVFFRESGECIIYPPTIKQTYGSDGMNMYGNDWMHISGRGVQPFLKSLALPLNTPLQLTSAKFIPKCLQEISLEISNHHTSWELGVDLRVRSFLLELSRAVSQKKERASLRDEEMYILLNRLRLDMQARCTELWSIERMLGHVHMSRSKFTLSYRKLFNTSPINDLLDMRISLAKQYLVTTDMSVTQTASVCGFSDVYYFCRIFKKKTGESPGTFRNDNTAPSSDANAQIWKSGKPIPHSRRYASKQTKAGPLIITPMVETIEES